MALHLHEARLLAIETDDGSMEALYVRTVLSRLVNHCIDNPGVAASMPGALATDVIEGIYDLHEYVNVSDVRTRLALAVIKARQIIQGDVS